MEILNKLRTKLNREGRYFAKDIRHRLGFYEDFYTRARGSRIVIYHGICMNDPTRFNPIFLKLKTFEQHLQFYKKYVNVVSLDDYYQQKFSNDKFNVCLTFDDGFANNYKYVLPLLEQYLLPATFFVTAISGAGYDILWNDFLGIISKYGPDNIFFKDELYNKGPHNKYISAETNISLVERLRLGGFTEKAEMMESLNSLVSFKDNKQEEDYWLQMTSTQIRALSASSFASIGSHSCFHNDLAQIDIDDVKTDLINSKKYLENIIQKSVKSVAFPYGSYTPDVINTAKQSGYDKLLATDFIFSGDVEDTSMRERFTVNPFISTNSQMYATITKRYER